MQRIKRLFYLFYYLKELDFTRLKLYLNYSSTITGITKLGLIFDSVYSVFRYNTALMDYFYFGFYNLKNEERSEWAGTGFMYEYQLIMNPKNSRYLLENKLAFIGKFKSFVKRNCYSLQSLVDNPEFIKTLLNNPSGKIVLKNSFGQAGKEIKILNNNEISEDSLVELMSESHYNLAEDYIIQHPDMMKMSPSGLNTVRIVTQEDNGKIEFIAARLRISINSDVDNMAAGNAAAPIDLISGRATGPAVFSDITKVDISFHPLTNVKIPGFQIPYWNEILIMVKEAALMVPENRSIGWDIAITSAGPSLVEGNHNWCKLLWQLPVKRGLKDELERYL